MFYVSLVVTLDDEVLIIPENSVRLASVLNMHKPEDIAYFNNIEECTWCCLFSAYPHRKELALQRLRDYSPYVKVHQIDFGSEIWGYLSIEPEPETFFLANTYRRDQEREEDPLTLEELKLWNK